MISGFLHESIVPGPWSNILKYLPKMFLRRYLQKDLQPPGSCTQRLQKWSIDDHIFLPPTHNPRHAPINHW